MYALFYEVGFEPITVCPSKTQAVAMGKLLSRETGRSVVQIFNRDDGTTTVCCKFLAGEMTYDGGCCPSEWAKVAAEAMSLPRA